METRTLVYFGAGLLVGYLIFKNRKKVVESVTEIISETPKDGDKTEGGMDKAKFDSCQKKWMEFSKAAKFASEKGRQDAYDNFMSNCMATA